MTNRAPDMPSPHAIPTLRNYLRSVRDWHGYIRFLGLPHLRENPDVVIDRLFVEPRLASGPISADQSPDDWPLTSDLLATIAERRRLVLLGDPGSGKSTLISWVCWQLAQPRPGRWVGRLGPLVPLPLTLRELRIGPDLDWDGLLAAFLEHPLAEPLRDGTTLDDLLQRGQAMILLDGLDEIADLTSRRALRRAVKVGMAKYPDCRWLLTSRVVGYDEVPFDDLGDSAAESSDEALAGDQALSPQPLESSDQSPGPAIPESSLRGVLRHLSASLATTSYLSQTSRVSFRRHLVPFNDGQIKQFVEAWYLLREPVRTRAAGNAQDLIQAIQADPTTRRLARTPNLLTMMALIHRVRARLPHGRALLYGEIAQAYLQSIDEFRGLAPVDYSLAQKRRWLARIAFEMQRGAGDAEATADAAIPAGRPMLATADQVRGWVRSAMSASGLGDDPATADQFIRYIGRRSGLLLPRGPGVFAFLHLSLQEYFAALFLKEQVVSPRWIRAGEGAHGASRDDLRRYARDRRWQETLLFLFELLADQPDWAATLAEALFGDDFADIDSDDPQLQPAGLLLARVAADPHAGLGEHLRKRAFFRCMRRELQVQMRATSGLDYDGFALLLSGHEAIAEIARELFADQENQRLAWESLIAAGLELQVDSLVLWNCKEIRDASPLAEMPRLRRLNIKWTPLTNLSFLAGLPHLESLAISGTSLVDASPLSELIHLRTLWINDPPANAPIGRVTSLESLYVASLHLSQSYIDQLSQLKALELLAIMGDTKIDLSPLTGLPNLSKLFLVGRVVDDVSPLERISSLNNLWLDDEIVLSEQQLATLKEANPNLVLRRVKIQLTRSQ